MTRQDAKFLRYLCVESKQELLDVFRKYISVNSTDSTNKTTFNINLTNKKVLFAPTVPTTKPNSIIPVDNDEAAMVSVETSPASTTISDSTYSTATIMDSTNMDSTTTDEVSDESDTTEETSDDSDRDNTNTSSSI